MPIGQQFREVFRLLVLTLEGKNPKMSRGELLDRSLDRMMWVFGPAVALMLVALIVAALAG